MDERTLELLCQMEREHSLQHLVDLAFPLLGNPMFYQDAELNIPYYTRCTEIPDPFWQRNVVQGSLNSGSILQEPGRSALSRHRPGQREPVELPPDPSNNGSRGSYALSLSTGNLFHGVLILTSLCRDFQPEDKLLFQLFGEIFYARLSHDISLGVSDHGGGTQLILKLLSGTPVSQSYLDSQMKKLNWQPLRYGWVITICSTKDAESTSSLEDVIHQLSRSQHCCLVRYQGSLVYLYTAESLVWSPKEQLAELISLWSSHHLCAGCSRPFTQLTSLASHYKEAQEALALGQQLEPGKCFYDFGELAVYALLDQWHQQGSLRSLIEPGVLQLWQREQPSPILIPTLDRYLSCGMDASLTAEQLFIHKNTVRYRIQRCEEMLQKSLTDGDTLFRLKLSIRAIDYLQKIGEEGELLSDPAGTPPGI